MIKPIELRLGNRIYKHFEGGPGEEIEVSVRDIFDAQRSIVEKSFKFSFSGIPLTEEWLLKFGFYLHEESRHKFPATRDLYDKSKIVERLDKSYKFRYDRSDPETDSRDMDVLVILDPETLKIRSMGIVGIRDIYCCADIHYVHQLQNLYFALTGEELELTPSTV